MLAFRIIVIIALCFIAFRAFIPKINLRDMANQAENASLIMQRCRFYIEQFELGNITHKPSCKNDLVDAIQEILVKTRESIGNIDDNEEIDKIAISTISYVSSELLMSGKYHIYTGTFDPLNCGDQLKRVYINSMQEAVKRGYIDTETYKNHRDHVEETISYIG